MRSTASLGFTFAAVLLTGAALVIACGDDDPAPPTSGTSSSGSSGTSGTSGTSGGGTSGTSGSGTSGGTSGAPQDAGNEAATNLENGAACSGDTTGNAECKSGNCKSQGGGGGSGGGTRRGNFCTIPCTMPNSPDPVCTGSAFTGQCRGQGFCQVQ